ncbi:glycosyltransferase [Owenweeksia hongkongensis]|uniref:glycosyltransferase n=1 Tax=Owenweeksia hongkongensis TaxID=253245 RepID=UPI003A8F5A78
MIWLSSFPRSGNTFFRNVLFEVYGLESSSFYENVGEPVNYMDFPFVKTHMRPHELQPLDLNIPAVHLVRDGRDALVSMAHQRKDIYEPDSDFRGNFLEALVAAEESYFGGWSLNVEDWLSRADVLIRFEDLIENPIAQLERLRSIYELPEPNVEKLPGFKDLKFGAPQYGRGKRVAGNEQEELEIVRKSFRKGKAYGWKEELDRELQNIFWSYHRNMMDRLGYTREGGIRKLNPDFDYQVIKLLGYETPLAEEKYRVLIEANKLLMHQNDGVKRYLLELLKALYPVTQNENSHWQIDIFLKGRVYSLKDYGERLFDSKKNENHYNRYTRISKSIRGVLKLLVPKAYRDTSTKYVKKVMMKVGLKFAKSMARTRYAFERMKSGKEAARENFEAQIGSVELGVYDLVHVPLPQHYEPFKGTQNNYLVTLHDLTHRLFEEYHTSSNIQVAEKGMQFFLDQKADFLCISETTKKDLLSQENIEENRTHIVYEAADNQKFRPNLNSNKGLFVRTVYGIPQSPFLFTLSTLEPRKNLMNTIRAFDELLDEYPEMDVNLVIGGKNGWKSKDVLQLKHKKRIIFTGFIDENDLPILYNEAMALCYVSHYEGFGLPPLEAMSCKTPVIFGDNSSMKEIFEGYGLAAKSDEVASIKEQMKKILLDKNLREELRERSIERSFDFSWRQTAIETLGVYERTITKTNKG